MADKNPLRGQFIRFFIVAVGGLVIDLAIVWLTLALLPVHISIAMIAGFSAGALANYLAHEFWTFKSGEGTQASVGRAASYYVIVSLALGVRVGAATVLEHFFPTPQWLWPIIIVSVGLSFVTNFGLTRFVLFRDQDQSDSNKGMS